MVKTLWGLGLFLLVLSASVLPGTTHAYEAQALSAGDFIIVPTYSYVLIGDNARPFPLSATLCLRNTSMDHEITLLSVDYYDSAGKLVKKYLEAPRKLAALASLVFTVAESERAGSWGAKFLVHWSSSQPVSPLLAEAIMIGTANQQGISFTSRGQVIPRQP